MRRWWWLGFALIPFGLWVQRGVGAGKETSRWTLNEVPISVALTPEGMDWIQRDAKGAGRSILWHLDVRSGQRKRLYEGEGLRGVRRLEDGRWLVVESGPPETPPKGPSVFPQARILVGREGRIQPLVESAPFCVEAIAGGDTVVWVAVRPQASHRFFYLPFWSQADLFLTRNGETRHLLSLPAPAGRWQGKLLGIKGNTLLLVERMGLPRERIYSRLLRVSLTTGEAEVLITVPGEGDWLYTRGYVYGTTWSREAQYPASYVAIFRWSEAKGLEWLTDWLLPMGRLGAGPKRVYYANLDGLWEIPETMDMARKRMGHIGRALALAVTARGAWMLLPQIDQRGRTVGCLLTYRRFGQGDVTGSLVVSSQKSSLQKKRIPARRGGR